MAATSLARKLLGPSLAALAIALGACGGMQGDGAKDATEPRHLDQHRELSELDALEHDLRVSEQRLLAELARKQSEAVFAGAPGQDKGAPAPESSLPSVTPGPPAPALGAPVPPSAAPAPVPADEAPPRLPDGDDAAPSMSATPRAERVGSACDLACRALGSMRRSADGICSITGDDSPRCDDARRRVTARENDVKNAGCACRER